MVQRCPHGQGQRVPIVSGGPAIGKGGSPPGVPCPHGMFSGHATSVPGGSSRLVRGWRESLGLYGCKYRGSKTNAGSPIAVGLDLEVGPPPSIGIYRPGCSRGYGLNRDLESAPGRPVTTSKHPPPLGEINGCFLIFCYKFCQTNRPGF